MTDRDALSAPVRQTLEAIPAARQGSTSTSQPTLTVGTSVNAGAAVVASVDPPPSPTANVDGAPA